LIFLILYPREIGRRDRKGLKRAQAGNEGYPRQIAEGGILRRNPSSMLPAAEADFPGAYSKRGGCPVAARTACQKGLAGSRFFFDWAIASEGT